MTDSQKILWLRLLGFFIGSVGIFHGLYSKLSEGVPRHRLIVGRIMGEEFMDPLTIVIGVLEVLLGLWVFSGYLRWVSALTQTLALVTMNFLEIWLASDLLISGPGMAALNVGLITLAWYWALAKRPHTISGTVS